LSYETGSDEKCNRILDKSISIIITRLEERNKDYIFSKLKVTGHDDPFEAKMRIATDKG